MENPHVKYVINIADAKVEEREEMYDVKFRVEVAKDYHKFLRSNRPARRDATRTLAKYLTHILAKIDELPN